MRASRRAAKAPRGGRARQGPRPCAVLDSLFSPGAPRDLRPRPGGGECPRPGSGRATGAAKAPPGRGPGNRPRCMRAGTRTIARVPRKSARGSRRHGCAGPTYRARIIANCGEGPPWTAGPAAALGALAGGPRRKPGNDGFDSRGGLPLLARHVLVAQDRADHFLGVRRDGSGVGRRIAHVPLGGGARVRRPRGPCGRGGCARPPDPQPGAPFGRPSYACLFLDRYSIPTSAPTAAVT